MRAHDIPWAFVGLHERPWASVTVPWRCHGHSWHCHGVSWHRPSNGTSIGWPVAWWSMLLQCTRVYEDSAMEVQARLSHLMGRPVAWWPMLLQCMGVRDYSAMEVQVTAVRERARLWRAMSRLRHCHADCHGLYHGIAMALHWAIMETPWHCGGIAMTLP